MVYFGQRTPRSRESLQCRRLLTHEGRIPKRSRGYLIPIAAVDVIRIGRIKVMRNKLEFGALKKATAAMLALFGISTASAQEVKPQPIDPKSILFTVPTISNDMPPMEPLKETPPDSAFSFHEDDWSQLEFFPKDQLGAVQRLLSEYKLFEAKNREKYGWRDTYVRKIARVPVVSGSHAVADISRILGASPGPAPVLYSTSSITGRVTSGFSIPLGGNVTLYGYSQDAGIPVLGALVGRNPDDQKLVQAFFVLNEMYGLLLVDWRQQLLIVGRAADGSLSVWQP